MTIKEIQRGKSHIRFRKSSKQNIIRWQDSIRGCYNLRALFLIFPWCCLWPLPKTDCWPEPVWLSYRNPAESHSLTKFCTCYRSVLVTLIVHLSSTDAIPPIAYFTYTCFIDVGNRSCVQCWILKVAMKTQGKSLRKVFILIAYQCGILLFNCMSM